MDQPLLLQEHSHLPLLLLLVLSMQQEQEQQEQQEQEQRLQRGDTVRSVLDTRQLAVEDEGDEREGTVIPT